MNVRVALSIAAALANLPLVAYAGWRFGQTPIGRTHFTAMDKFAWIGSALLVIAPWLALHGLIGLRDSPDALPVSVVFILVWVVAVGRGNRVVRPDDSD